MPSVLLYFILFISTSTRGWTRAYSGRELIEYEEMQWYDSELNLDEPDSSEVNETNNSGYENFYNKIVNTDPWEVHIEDGESSNKELEKVDYGETSVINNYKIYLSEDEGNYEGSTEKKPINSHSPSVDESEMENNRKNINIEDGESSNTELEDENKQIVDSNVSNFESTEVNQNNFGVDEDYTECVECPTGIDQEDTNYDYNNGDIKNIAVDDEYSIGDYEDITKEQIGVDVSNTEEKECYTECDEDNPKDYGNNLGFANEDIADDYDDITGDYDDITGDYESIAEDYEDTIDSEIVVESNTKKDDGFTGNEGISGDYDYITDDKDDKTRVNESNTGNNDGPINYEDIVDYGDTINDETSIDKSNTWNDGGSIDVDLAGKYEDTTGDETGIDKSNTGNDDRPAYENIFEDYEDITDDKASFGKSNTGSDDWTTDYDDIDEDYEDTTDDKASFDESNTGSDDWTTYYDDDDDDDDYYEDTTDDEGSYDESDIGNDGEITDYDDISENYEDITDDGNSFDENNNEYDDKLTDYEDFVEYENTTGNEIGVDYKSNNGKYDQPTGMNEDNNKDNKVITGADNYNLVDYDDKLSDYEDFVPYENTTGNEIGVDYKSNNGKYDELTGMNEDNTKDDKVITGADNYNLVDYDDNALNFRAKYEDSKAENYEDNTDNRENNFGDFKFNSLNVVNEDGNDNVKTAANEINIENVMFHKVDETKNALDYEDFTVLEEENPADEDNHAGNNPNNEGGDYVDHSEVDGFHGGDYQEVIEIDNGSVGIGEVYVESFEDSGVTDYNNENKDYLVNNEELRINNSYVDIPHPKAEEQIDRFCNESNEQFLQKIDECLEKFAVNNNEKVVKIVIECYPGLEVPTSGLAASKWHCDSSSKDIYQSNMCMDKTLELLYKEEDSQNLVFDLWSCFLDAYYGHTAEYKIWNNGVKNKYSSDNSVHEHGDNHQKDNKDNDFVNTDKEDEDKYDDEYYDDDTHDFDDHDTDDFNDDDDDDHDDDDDDHDGYDYDEDYHEDDHHEDGIDDYINDDHDQEDDYDDYDEVDSNHDKHNNNEELKMNNNNDLDDDSKNEEEIVDNNETSYWDNDDVNARVNENNNNNPDDRIDVDDAYEEIDISDKNDDPEYTNSGGHGTKYVDDDIDGSDESDYQNNDYKTDEELKVNNNNDLDDDSKNDEKIVDNIETSFWDNDDVIAKVNENKNNNPDDRIDVDDAYEEIDINDKNDDPEYTNSGGHGTKYADDDIDEGDESDYQNNDYKTDGDEMDDVDNNDDIMKV